MISGMHTLAPGLNPEGSLGSSVFSRIMKTVNDFVLLCCLLTFTVHGSLSEEIRALLPAKKECRIVWSYGSSSNYHDPHQLRVLDTKTGLIRQLTYDSLFPDTRVNDLTMATITKDGQRVVFYNSTNLETYIINWDGTGLRRVASGGKIGDSWQDPVDHSQWILFADFCQDSMGPVYRINVDTYQKVLLWNRTAVGTWSSYELKASLSTDGKYMVASFPWPQKAIVAVPNAMGGTDSTALPDGCWQSMTDDGSYDVLHIVNHGVFTISNKSGQYIYQKSTRELFNVGPANGAGWEYTYARWSNNRDIVAFYIDKTTWPAMAGAAIASFNNGRFVRVDSTGGKIFAHVYDAGKDWSTAPVIACADTFRIMRNATSSIPIDLSAISPATLSADGLPGGLTIRQGNGDPHCFLTGSAATSGTFYPTLHAQNSAGTASRAVVLIVADTNRAPVFRKDNDITVKPPEWNSLFMISANVNDDGFQGPLTYRWSLLTGQPGVLIGSPQTFSTKILLPSHQSDLYLFAVIVSDGEYTVTDTVSVTMQGSLPSQILFPGSNATLQIGTTYTIRWQWDPPEGVVLRVSTNEGLTFKTLNPLRAVIPSTAIAELQWTPDSSFSPGPTCVLQISSYADPSKYIQGLFTLAAKSSAVATTHSHSLPQPFFRPLRRDGNVFKANTNTDCRIFSLTGARVPAISSLNGAYTMVARPGLYVVSADKKNINGRRRIPLLLAR